MLKNLFQLPLRQTTGLVGSLLKFLGLNWVVPDYSTLSRRQKHLKVKIPYSRNAQAVIPVRKNGRLWKEKTVWVVARNEILRSQQRQGKTIWKTHNGGYAISPSGAGVIAFSG